MKSIIAVVSLAALLGAGSAFAAALDAHDTQRLKNASAVLTEIRSQPDKGVPEGLWSRAECVIVIPDLKKAAFMVGGEYGKGVMSCRNANAWSAPVFMQLAKGSWGFQVGAEQVDLVLLVMNRRGAEKLLSDKVSLGADASVAAGPVGRSVAADTDARISAEILAYSRSKGLFAGVDINGGVLRPETHLNEQAYGTNVTPQDIAFGKHVVIPAAAREFVRGLGSETRATTGTTTRPKREPKK